MADTTVLMRLRRLLQDLYGQDGSQLAQSAQAFADDELADLYDNAVTEASDGKRGAATATSLDSALAMLIARADGLLMLAQDSARRHLWTVNNKTLDEDNISGKLVAIARELRQRYTEHQNRTLKREIEDLTDSSVTPGGTLVFNNSTPLHSDRDFSNRDVNRNQPRR